jgi:hypothetical protein
LRGAIRISNAYVSHDPINLADPSGKFFSAIGWTGVLVFGYGAVTGNVPAMVIGGGLTLVDVYLSIREGQEVGKERGEEIRDTNTTRERFIDEHSREGGTKPCP